MINLSKSNQHLSIAAGAAARIQQLVTAGGGLNKGSLLGAIACLTVTALGAAQACTEPQLHQTTRAAGFLRDCGGQTPASVASINSSCPNVHRGLVARGSSVTFVQGVTRTLSGQKGLWYKVRVIHNQSMQNASANAQSGAVGWMRANQF